MGKKAIIHENETINSINIDESCLSRIKSEKGSPPVIGFKLDDNRCFFTKEFEYVESIEGEKGNYQTVYKSSYIVGAQWVNKAEQVPLVIHPKQSMKNLDYVKMLMTCLQGGMATESECFSHVYGIDIDGERIETDLATTVLDPLLLCHFLCLVEKIVKRGLKRGYVLHNENLKKCRGRIDVFKNERRNVLLGRSDRVYCSFSNYEVNIPENKVIKRALLTSKYIYSQLSLSNKRSLLPVLNRCLAAFDSVDDDIQPNEIRAFKANKLFFEYAEAVDLAKIILRRSGLSSIEISNNKNLVPPFWVDMPMLFEYYLLFHLREQFGDCVKYQDEWETGIGKFSWRPDYLFIDDDNPMIFDAKYIPFLDQEDRNEKLSAFVRQLSGYARIPEIRERMGLEPDREFSVPCVLIYASNSKDAIKDFSFIELTEEGLADYAIPDLYKFYLIPVNLPRIR